MAENGAALRLRILDCLGFEVHRCLRVKYLHLVNQTVLGNISMQVVGVNFEVGYGGTHIDQKACSETSMLSFKLEI